jgi:hypothetical protein
VVTSIDALNEAAFPQKSGVLLSVRDLAQASWSKMKAKLKST